ncbi:MAG TPA: hypothetical protein VFT14_03220 [Solirubrobacterales bacterium]|nr:hypothetical protein [Solirubrobacterales bacterium]
MAPRIVAAAALLPALLLGAGCGSDDESASERTEAGSSTLPQGADGVSLDPAEFTTEITNPYWPMRPGSRWVYRETDGDAVQRVVVTVTERTKRIANGIEARVVRDVVSEDDEPVEVTDDWYAQDSDGNVWYMGEDTAEYENGKIVSREGSFEAGVDGAQPGVIMPADPEVGQSFRQEYLEGEAEDRARVLSLDAEASVPFGSFEGVLQTEDTNPLSDPPEVEHKFYARDIGPVLAIGVAGGSGREELVSYTR